MPGHYRPAQPIQLKCLSSLCSSFKGTLVNEADVLLQIEGNLKLRLEFLLPVRMKKNYINPKVAKELSLCPKFEFSNSYICAT